ncbi:diacylglycerol kinase [Candidatus Saccharibacteria bacterium]|nr:diacylglycerol kinase [Candidatus Saccharibacteria bacterium]
MSKYDHIVVIYNPKSTGKSRSLAKAFVKKAKAVHPNAKVDLIPTERMSHAEELAATAVKKTGEVLLVSSSGDGGYNEVINGVMKSTKPTKHVTCVVLPAGNANDHSRTMHEAPLVKHLAKAKEIEIDLLKITITQASGKIIRYAHSYAGLGLTPAVGAELNKHDLNPIKETILAAKTFRDLEPFKIVHNNKTITLDSLILSNINQMAKVLTLSDENTPTDGLFEVIIFSHASKPKLLYKVAKAAINQVQPAKRAKRYSFKALHSMPMQLDGEVIKLQKDAAVTVAIAHRGLRTLI